MNIKSGHRIYVTEKNEETINSEKFKSFVWREKSDYKYGQLCVSFKEYGSYMYDVPFTFFEEMANRAYNPEKYKMLKTCTQETPYEYYDTNMVKVIDEDKDPLYEDKYLYEN